MSQYIDGIVLRTFAHETVESFAKYATVPVVNGLSDYAHPCQALADLLTVQEVFGDLSGRTLVFVGDGNNVARSLALGCGLLGVRFILSAPPGYGFDRPFLELCRERVPQGEPLEIADPFRAVAEADVIYTDVWTSMGQEAEKDARRQAFAAYQVNEELLNRAPSTCVVMHCLPAHRGEEITNEVLDSDRSIAFQQAGNRLHAQKALLQWLLVDEQREKKESRSKAKRLRR
jgi:ornithine carbamoyltransferase